MRCLRAIGLFAAEISLLLFVACGGGGSKNDDKLPVSVSITQSTRVRIGESKTIPVSTQNTDFTATVSPASGSGCAKEGSAVKCTPTLTGTYTVTVTATEDTSKKSSLVLTVPELEILGEDELIIYADETEGEEIGFYSAGNWEATATDNDTGNAPTWLTISVKNSSAENLSINSALGLYETGTTVSGSAGYYSLTVTLELNYSGEERSATITIATANGEIKIIVIQQSVTENGTPLTPDTVTVSISPAAAGVILGNARTFSVTAQNTDFTLSVSPATGSGCVKSGGGVVCTPTVLGTYSVTVTATVDATITSTAVLTVEPSVTISIGIFPNTESVILGQSRTFAVTSQNTNFTLSVTPTTGSGCVKSGNNVVCTPTTAGTYTVTVTADADSTKTSTAVLTATGNVDQLISSGHTALKNEQYDEAIVHYENAYKADNTNVKAVIYSTLGKIAQISTDQKVENLLKNRFGFKQYPSRLNALLSDEWMKEYIEWLEWGYYDDTVGEWLDWYDEWHVEWFKNDPNYRGVDKPGYYYNDGCDYDYEIHNYVCNYVFISDEKRSNHNTISLPELLIPDWVKGGNDSWYSETLMDGMPGFDTWILLLVANIVDKNPDGVNGIIDELIPALFEGPFVEALNRVKNLENNKTAITLDRDFIDALYLDEFMDEYDPIGWAELNGVMSSMLIVKASLQYVAAYDLNTDFSFMKYAWKNDGDDFHQQIYDYLKENKSTALPFYNNFMNARSDGQARMNTAKASFIEAIQGLQASYDAIIESPLYPTVVKDAYPTISEGIGKLITAIQTGGKFWIPEDP